MRIFIFTVAILTAGFSSAAPSTAEQIQAAAAQYIEHFAKRESEKGFLVHHELGNLDPRLSLAPCEQPLDVSFSGDPWKTQQPSLLVSCEAERPWRMFLPVSLEIQGQGLVAARPLARGERLTEAALVAQTVVVNATRRSPITDKAQLIGMEMRRAVNTGTPLTPDLLTAPEAIQRGDHVVISAQTQGFTVRSRGKALASGGIGDQVLVENLSSARTVRAQITGPGQVRIPM